MKSVSVASMLLGSALALMACGPDGRDGNGQGTTDGGPGSGDGGTGTAQACQKMDLVFVVDDSGSMAEEQTNLATNFPMFADVLQNYVNADGEKIDFRIAVTTTGKDFSYTISVGGGLPPQTITESGDNGEFKNNCGVARRWLEPTDPGLGSTLGCRANVGTGGSGTEMPLLMSKVALADRVADGTNAGFLRQDALLGIVILTDEDDSSTSANNVTVGFGGSPAPDFHAADLVTFLDQLKGNRTRWAAGVIAGPTMCTSSFGSADPATRLQEFVTLSNAQGPQQAVFTSICDGNLTTALTDIVNKFQSACGNIIL